MKKVVIFQVEQQQYGIDINQIHSIERVFDITPIPQTKSYIKGMIHLRGEVIPIIDLKERLDVGTTKIQDQTRIIIVNLKGISTGLLVDAATDVIDLPLSSIQESPDILEANTDHLFIKGIAKLEEKLIVLLDAEELLSRQMMKQIEKSINKSPDYA